MNSRGTNCPGDWTLVIVGGLALGYGIIFLAAAAGAGSALVMVERHHWVGIAVLDFPQDVRRHLILSFICYLILAPSAIIAGVGIFAGRRWAGLVWMAIAAVTVAGATFNVWDSIVRRTPSSGMLEFMVALFALVLSWWRIVRIPTKSTGCTERS